VTSPLRWGTSISPTAKARRSRWTRPSSFGGAGIANYGCVSTIPPCRTARARLTRTWLSYDAGLHS